VAQFRVAYDLWAPDPAFTGLTERLRTGCPEFVGWWDEHDVLGGGAGRKVLHHPERGVVTCDYATFRVNEAPELRLTVYVSSRSGAGRSDGDKSASA
jgi:hypothetical protein